MNIVNCSKCNRKLIIEEVELHECRKVVDYRIEGSILWLFDGEIWYPRKLKTYPTKFDTKNFRRRLDNTLKQ